MDRGRDWTPIIIVVLLLCLLCSASVVLIPLAARVIQEWGPWPTASPVVSPAVSPGATATPIVPSEALLKVPGEDPPTLDPALVGDSTSHQYVLLIFSGLVALNENLEVVPDIAERWEVSTDGKTYTFYLRHGARFQDGKAVTAQDFKYSLERACDPATESRSASQFLGDIVGAKEKLAGEAEDISGIKVVDDYTLSITIDAPKAYFLAKLTYPVAFVVDRANVEEGEDWTVNPNGTGPFILSEKSEDTILLTRNELYYQGTPALEGVEFILYGDAMNMYEQGELDVVGVSANDIERVLDPQGQLHNELVTVPGLDTTYIGMNVTMPPFDDPLVRQAFAYATDKERLIEVLLPHMAVEAKGILPPGMPGYNPDLAGIPYDPERARELLAASKYGGPEGIPSIVLTGGGAVGEALADMYEQDLGISISLEELEWEYFLEDVNQGRLQMFILGWTADYLDPENFLDLLFHSQSEGNHTMYSNPQVDGLLETARTEGDHDRRMTLYQDAEETIVEDAPWVPLFHSVQYVLVKPYVKGLVVSPQGVLLLKDVYLGGGS